MKIFRSSILALACFACANDSTPKPAEPVAKPEPAESPASEPITPKLDYRPALGEVIAASGYTGTFVLLDPATETLIVAEPQPSEGATSLAETGFSPASTFKIPNSLIALETGVADGPEFPLPWDGVERWNEAWNQDHIHRTAFQKSVVWYYQELARRIGEERMQEFIDAFDYGNRDISGGIDQFWLSGALRISPREQVEFLRRLHQGELPLSERTLAIMLDDIMVHERSAGGTIVRAKTGWGDAPPQNIGWFVGSVERQDRSRAYFAVLILAGTPAPETFRTDRIDLAFALLAELGWVDPATK
jgi:beta-lactamase class D